jgi:hypothetical protein
MVAVSLIAANRALLAENWREPARGAVMSALMKKM